MNRTNYYDKHHCFTSRKLKILNKKKSNIYLYNIKKMETPVFTVHTINSNEKPDLY